MEIREVLALNLRKHRRAKGLSQEELAHRAEIDRTYISALERSVYAAGIDVVDRLARVLGLEAADLLQRPQTPAKGKSRLQNQDDD
jgi:transcriptional regulator with XRE-family HTH domain